MLDQRQPKQLEGAAAHCLSANDLAIWQQLWCQVQLGTPNAKPPG